ncbi:GAF domain-containing protein, partial [bacterium]|nr:GAF domain-containing protein [bacterium]
MRDQGRRRLEKGDPKGALAPLEEAFAHARASGERPLELEVLLDLSRAYEGTNAHDRSLVCLREAWDLAEALRDEAARIEVLLARARSKALAGDPEGALVDYEDARGRARSRGDDAAAARATLGAREATRIGRPTRRVVVRDDPQGESAADPAELARLRRERAFLLRLQEVARALNAPQEPQQVLDRVVDAAVALTGAERGFLILTQEAKSAAPKDAPVLAADKERGVPEGLVVASARNVDREAVGRPAFKVSRGVLGQALEERKTILVRDASLELSEHSSVAEQGLRSLVGVPIACEGRILGLLYLDNRFDAGKFGESDLPLLEAFAGQAGAALENARLRAEERARADELTKARAQVEELNSQLRTNLDRRTQELESSRSELALARAALGEDDIVGRAPA